MSLTPEELEVAIATLQADMAKFNEIINGTDATIVVVDSGNVPSVAKAIADLNIQYASDNTLANALVYVDDSREWATHAENSEYTDSQANSGYSAYHWAQKASIILDSIAWKIVQKTNADSPVNLTDADGGTQFVIDTSGGNVVVNLPSIGDTGEPFNISINKKSGDANTVTVNASGSETIDSGASTKVQNSIGTVTYYADTAPVVDNWVSNTITSAAGNITDEIFNAGSDFTAGVSTTLTLSKNYLIETNLWVYFDGVLQSPDTYSLSGVILTFGSAIGGGVTKIVVKGGSTVSIGVPADYSVGLEQQVPLNQGSIIFAGPGGYLQELMASASNYALMSNGPAANPSFKEVPYPPGYRVGFFLQLSTGDSDHDLVFSPGHCRDDLNTRNINSALDLTKKIDATFAEGDDAGGLFSGSITPNTEYYIYAIAKADNTVDAGFSTTYPPADIPAGFLFYSLLDLVATDASSRIINSLNGVFISRLTTYTNGNSFDFKHILQEHPTNIELWAECIVTQGGWAIGDRILIGGYDSNGSTFGFGIEADEINIKLGITTAGLLATGTTNSGFALSSSNWKLQIIATAANGAASGIPGPQGPAGIDGVDGINTILRAQIAYRVNAGVPDNGYTGGSWETIPFNYIMKDPSGIITDLSSNTLTLGAGTYEIDANTSLRGSSSSTRVWTYRLLNVTDAVVLLEGVANHSAGGGAGVSNRLFGEFILDTTKVIKMQVYCTGNMAALNGIGASPYEYWNLMSIKKYV